jgi:hypothetical protein
VSNGAVTVPVTQSSYQVTGLNIGQSYTWSVATTYQPGNITSPASEFPTASASVTKYSGNYRITLLGFTVGNPTVDDLLDSDGRMDEIMPLVYVRQFDQASGTPVFAAAAKGHVHGDNQGKFRARVRAGTASNSGGLQKNDVFPAGLMQGPPASPSTTTFPLKVFEGFLTRDKDVLRPVASALTSLYLPNLDVAPMPPLDEALADLLARTGA